MDQKRQLALELAVKAAEGSQSHQEIVEAAKAFHAFLNGGE